MLGFETTELAAVLGAISVATERVVELVKGFFPWLREKLNKPTGEELPADQEARRRAANHLVAIVVGFLLLLGTKLGRDAGLSADQATSAGFWRDTGSLLLLSAMASGGSGLWNSVLDLVAKLGKKKEG